MSETSSEVLDAQAEAGADYLEGLLDLTDTDGDIEITLEEDRVQLAVVGAEVSNLVGRDGAVLYAIQNLVRLAAAQATGERSNLVLDIDGYRKKRITELEELARDTVLEAKESAVAIALDPMGAFERKIVHDAVAAAGGSSESEGEEPDRYVVVLP